MKDFNIIFVHANGYPPECYTDLFSYLNQLGTIHKIQLKPLQKAYSSLEYNKDWLDFLPSMMDQIEKLKLKKIIAIGHSMGGVLSTIVATKYPNLFSKIILIDPTFLNPKYIYLSRFMPNFVHNKYNPIVKKALNRNDHWESTKEVYKSFRKKNIFKRIPDQYLNSLINGLLIRKNNYVSLKFSKQWEAHCYRSIINPWPWIKSCHVPTLGIRGEYSTVINNKSFKLWEKYQHDIKLISIKDADHLVPFEKPKEIASEIIKFIS
jgi:pimeloyl-ACP methyl ester carboxylesterase